MGENCGTGDRRAYTAIHGIRRRRQILTDGLQFAAMQPHPKPLSLTGGGSRGERKGQRERARLKYWTTNVVPSLTADYKAHCYPLGAGIGKKKKRSRERARLV